MNMKDKMKHLFWIDLEMTGLEVEKEVIIEVAAVVTDLDFNAIDQYHAVVKQPQSYLDNMDEWNTKHHTESGLVSEVPLGKAPDDVESDLIALCKKIFIDERVVIDGNSISQDRLFIDKYFKNFSQLLHYRMLDVTAWKLLFNHKFGVTYKKNNAHRAIDDINESIEELKTFLAYVSV